MRDPQGRIVWEGKAQPGSDLLGRPVASQLGLNLVPEGR
jgi:hypothetical protein